MNITLQLGGYLVRMSEAHAYPRLAWPLRPFETFVVTPTAPPDIDVQVEVVSTLPEFGSREVRFDAGQGLWKLFDGSDGFVLESLHTQTHQPRARARVSNDYRTLHAWILPELMGGQVGWCPMYLFNPIVEVCFLSLLAREGGLLLHGAGLVYRQQGLIFAGPSGAGKSTIAQYFADQAATVLSDERVILRHDGDTCTIYGTPWVGSGEYAANASTTLTALVAISHGSNRHELAPLHPAKAISLLMRQAFLPQWDRDAMERTLDTLVALTEVVPCIDLAALKQPDVVDAVQRYLANLSPALT